MQAAGDKTFLLGIGTQKAGTTWLSRYVRSFDSSDFGICEEYHVWDGIADPVWTKFRIALKPPPSLPARIREAFTFTERPRRVRARMQSQPDRYFDYFAERLAPERVRLTGDITPTYMSLAPETYARIVRGFEERGIGVKVVLLLRDPVERCWSSVRMHRRKGRDSESVEVALGEEAALSRYYPSDHALSLTRYDRTLATLEAAIPADRIHVGITESMFDAAEVERLSAFLAVPPRPHRGEFVINRTPKQDDLPEPLVAEIARFYAEVYRFAADRFPETKGLWRGFRFL